MSENRLIWKLRFIKPYPDAHNHLLVGQVVARGQVCLELMCRTFHYGRSVNGLKDIVVGALGKRIVPWSRIEIINELPASFDFQNAKLKADQKGGVFFSNSHFSCPIVTILDKHY